MYRRRTTLPDKYLNCDLVGRWGFQAGLGCCPPTQSFMKIKTFDLPDCWYLQEETQTSIHSVGSSCTPDSLNWMFLEIFYVQKCHLTFENHLWYLFTAIKTDKSVAGIFFWINLLLDVQQLNIHIFIFLGKRDFSFLRLYALHCSWQVAGNNGKKYRALPSHPWTKSNEFNLIWLTGNDIWRATKTSLTFLFTL